MIVWDMYISDFLQEYEFIFQLFLSAMLGFFIGFDRTQKHKPAGVKTYTFVTAACALITLISIESVDVFSGIHETVRMDPMRLTAQIVTGLGFIGAGLILKTGVRVVGLTSAAMIFFAGGVGIGVGAGFYSIVISSIIITFLFVSLGNAIEKRAERKEKRLKRLEQTKAELLESSQSID